MILRGSLAGLDEYNLECSETRVSKIRADRARVYEAVLHEGQPEDVLRYVDGALLVDLWAELVLPRDVRAAWSPSIDPLLEPAPPAAAKID
jgi:hypothetical protein